MIISFNLSDFKLNAKFSVINSLLFILKLERHVAQIIN
ncbi:hypothetical protein HMPREF1568_2580 [Providencia alcalifaciens PAL-3]|nr:hypothetical protein HMPREF1568_2580 [Providencia alcalifaciens PAL-3]EUC98307.1 hypothetical protein HMPREF1566_2389 [Providencia alcalifaciens PAL-1]